MDHEALRIAFANLFRDRNFTAILADLQNETDRAAAVLGAAFLDESLNHLLAASIVGGTRIEKRLLGRERPLGAFGARILAAFAFGLISQEEFDDLELVREIRNAFAHRDGPLSFGSPEVSALAGRLHLGNAVMRMWKDLKDFPQTPRKAFDISIGLLGALLGMRQVSCGRMASPPAALSDTPPTPRRSGA